MSQITLDTVIEKGIYFVLPEGDAFCHLSICLAEGLSTLGVPLYCNQNYWLIDRDSQEYLLPHDPDILPEDCALCIVDIHVYPLSDDDENHIREIFNACEHKVALLNTDDFFWREEFCEFIVFRTHVNSEYFHLSQGHFIPWPFGLSRRLLNATRNSEIFSDREKRALINFRPSSNQSVRVAMEYIFTPYLQQLFEIDRTIDSRDDLSEELDDTVLYVENYKYVQGRHKPSYYRHLCRSMVSCCYGGNFTYAFTSLSAQPTIMRWDSWRFWESLAAGCATIHLDMEKYGLMLPIMPQNWKHYIGVDLARPHEIVERVNDEPDLLKQISEQGHNWALEHYGPEAIATYFLDIILQEELGTTREVISLLNGMP